MTRRGKKKKYNRNPLIAKFYILPYRKKGKKYEHAIINISKRIILRLGWSTLQELDIKIEGDKLIITPRLKK